MKIAVLGGGNMGSVLAVRFSQRHSVSLYVRSLRNETPYHKDMSVLSDAGVVLTGRIELITSNLRQAVLGAEWIFITYPSFMFEELSRELVPLLSEGQHLVFVPGSGGAELFFQDAIKKGCSITGLQRVHCDARLIEKGVSARESGIRKSLRIATIPNINTAIVEDALCELFSLPIETMGSFLNVTLVNSNSILHTSRLYCLFKDYRDGAKGYQRVPLFYEEWDNESSRRLIAMDQELFALINALNSLGCSIHHITPILQHYESFDATSLTAKIRSIQSLKGLKTPTVQLDDDTYLPDFDSRYFVADFPLGLGLILAFSELLEIKCPVSRETFSFYQKNCKSSIALNLSQFGINKLEDLIAFYN